MRSSAEKKPLVLDMTVGEPIKLIIAFALPLFIGNIFQEIYTMIDTMEMGYFVGDDAISAVGATTALYSLLMSLTISMNNGYAILITQAFGAHNETKLRRLIFGTFILNAAMTVVITLLSVIFLRPLLGFMNTPKGIFQQSYSYMLILCLGLFTTVFYNMFASILRSVGNSKTPLYVLIISSIINIALDLFFILVLKLGVVGTALGTVLAQGLSAFLCGRVLFRRYRFVLPRKVDFKEGTALMPKLLSSGIAMALMLCAVNLGSLIFQRANNVLGEEMIAAYTAARKIIVAFMQPLATIATANSTFVSQNWGAGNFRRIKTTLWKVMGLEAAWGAVACDIVYLIDEPLMRLITGTENESIISGGVLAMRLSLPFFPILGVLLCLRTAMQSMGYKTAPVLSSCIELVMKFFCAAMLIPAYGYFGTCITEPVTWVIMTGFLFTAYMLARKKMFGQENIGNID